MFLNDCEKSVQVKKKQDKRRLQKKFNSFPGRGLFLSFFFRLFVLFPCNIRDKKEKATPSLLLSFQPILYVMEISILIRLCSVTSSFQHLLKSPLFFFTNNLTEFVLLHQINSANYSSRYFFTLIIVFSILFFLMMKNANSDVLHYKQKKVCRVKEIDCNTCPPPPLQPLNRLLNKNCSSRT
jgi:hypothetical protein